MQYTNWTKLNSFPAIAFELYSSMDCVCNPGVPSSSLTIGILTANFSTGARSSCVQQNHCTSRMSIQSPLRNDQSTMIQYTNWINSTPSQELLLSCIAQWLEHWVCNSGVANPSLSIGHPHCQFLYWCQEFLCPIEPLYLSEEKSITVEK